MTATPGNSDGKGGNGIDHGAEVSSVQQAVDAAAAEAAAQKAEDEAADAAGINGDVVEPEIVAELTADQKRIVELELDIIQLQEKLRQYSEAVDKVRGEFERSKARIERENERMLDDHKARAVQSLLPVADSLQQALTTAGDGGPAFVQGIGIVQGEFDKALVELGLIRFDPTGEDFDPERHDALTMMPVADKAHDGKVVQVLHSGAMIGDKVVKAASVVVGKFMS